ncbi:hypothetical protein H0H87_009735 [Tephrocybe sp. NHM501043]|nr:hypothetical protein H0H87_009735 [Tephrocybe sp. NHM501043]
MDDTAGLVNSEEAVSSQSQQETQSTQPASQIPDPDINDHLWGYLQPTNPNMGRIDFLRTTHRYTIGRANKLNIITLPGLRISNQHCTITWDGSESAASVIIMDNSSNGTFVNRLKIGRGHVAALRDGQAVSFGPSTDPNYCYIYHHTAYPPATRLETYYDLISSLGQGTYGIVKKALCRRTGEHVAIKMIKNTRTVQPLGNQCPRPRRDHFNREIDVLSRLEHNNICRLREAFVHDDTDDIELVLELVEGGDFWKYIIKHAPLGEVDSQHFTFQICDALAYIHSQNITHRDLKPENILLTKDNPPILKVADFGLAKFVDGQTMLKTMCGTPHYIAPEVVNNQGNNLGYDNLVDSWSVGVIVFSMLAAKNPFIEDTNQAPLDRVRNRNIDWQLLDSEDIAVSIEGITFIRNLLEIDPRYRMTLTEALEDVWLRSHLPVYGRNAILATNNYVMTTSVDNASSFGFTNANVGPSDSTTPSSTPSTTGPDPQGL